MENDKKTLTNKELAFELAAWHKRNLTNRCRYSDNEVGKMIRDIAESSGNWRAARRGNPRKGKEGQLLYYARQNGYVPPEENEEREDYN